MLPSISIIIPTYNRISALEETLISIFQGDVVPDELIIVDQTQDNKLATQINELVKSYKGIYLYSETPSLTKARNIGLKKATKDILVFMDDDVSIKPNTLSVLKQMFCEPSLGMVGGLNKETTTRNSILGYFFGKSSFLNRNIGNVSCALYGKFPLQCSKATPTMWAMGFFTVVRRSLLLKWNLQWDEHLQYYAYAEDLDLSYSFYKCAKKEGIKCIMSSDICVDHRVSQEYRISTTRNTYMCILHREYLSYKHFKSPLYRLATRWANLGDFFYRLLHRQRAKDVLKAQLFCDKYRKDIKNGIFHYELFMQ